MKLKITLIALSVVVIMAAGYVAWWMMFQADFQVEAPIHDGTEITGYTILSPEQANLVNAARYGSILLLLFGITQAIFSVLQKIKTYLIVSLAIAVLAVYISYFGFNIDFVSSTPSEGFKLLRIFTTPSSTERLAQIITIFTGLLGLIIAGIGIFRLRLKK